MSTINCIGFIMDGNRRWAREQGLPSMKGHQKGFETFKRVVEWGAEAKIPNMIFYAFSTENWKRSKDEVSYLFTILEQSFGSMLELAHKHKVRVLFLGQIERLPKPIQERIHNAEKETHQYSERTVGLALSYGGRADIVQAANTLIKEGVKEITEEALASKLWTADMPDPDLLVRTGEVMRLSNFLTWQSVYSELYFSGTLWPDFDKEEFTYILESFDEENRRKGT